MMKYTGFLGKIRMIKPVHIGVICLAFFVSVVSNSSFADNAVTGSGSECVYGTLNTYTGPSTIKANWDPNTINLYWYNDDTQTSSNTCNYDGSISLPATNPTKTGYTFSGWEVLGGVPAGYTMLEYIQSSGTQYIDTGITSATDTFFKLEVLFTSSGNGYRFFGTAGGGATVGFGSGSNALYLNNLNTPLVSDVSPLYNQRIVISYSGTTANINGTIYTCTQAQATTAKIYINARADSLSTRVASGRWYHVQIGRGTTLQRNMIPAKRNSDSVVGMYDTVSGTFFTNGGTGTFTAGPAVQ